MKIKNFEEVAAKYHISPHVTRFLVRTIIWGNLSKQDILKLLVKRKKAREARLKGYVPKKDLPGLKKNFQKDSLRISFFVSTPQDQIDKIVKELRV